MTQILNAIEIDQKIQRLAWQIYENHIHEKQIVLAGIHKNGYILAKEIYDILSNISKQKISLI